MAKILVVGGATLDIVNDVERYPDENSEIRALGQRVVRGGNAANTAGVLTSLGHEVAFIGTLASDASAELIRADLARMGVDTRYCPQIGNSVTPTSYICLSKATGTRSIVHYRQLPELMVADFCKVDLDGFDWVHFEGRNIDNIKSMIEKVGQSGLGVRCSLEVEKPRRGIESLFPYVDLLLFSKGYAQSWHFEAAEDFLKDLEAGQGAAIRVCAWGDKGAAAWQNNNMFVRDAVYLPKVVDTLGAGDVFNAGFIDGLLSGRDLESSLKIAVTLAGEKCQRVGL